MKISVKFLIPAIALVLIAVACGNQKSGAGSSEHENGSLKTAASQTPSDSGLPASFDFEDSPAGQLPAGWSEYYTGSGGTEWEIRDDNGNKVLAQLYSDNPNNHFNVVVNDSVTATDMVLTVRLKGVAGKHDQGGGFVWRFADKNNYYVVRANPLEDNVVLYKVEDGKRTDLPLVGKGRTYGVNVPPMGETWHTLKLTVKSDLFTVYLNDKELFQVQDNTFANAGKTGFWTKADAVTYFDDFQIKEFK